METIQERRARVLLQKEHARLREAHGNRLADALAHVSQTPISLADFQTGTQPPFPVFWSGSAEDTPGLVAAYISKTEALKLASCIANCMPRMGGLLGVYDNHYLGVCAVSEISVVGMIAAAEISNESIVFYPNDGCSALLVDCYESNPGEPFSVVVQGDALVDKVRDCF